MVRSISRSMQKVCTLNQMAFPPTSVPRQVSFKYRANSIPVFPEEENEMYIKRLPAHSPRKRKWDLLAVLVLIDLLGEQTPDRLSTNGLI